MSTNTKNKPDDLIDSFGVDRSLMSALGHAEDDNDRFQEACLRLIERSYYKVDKWFQKDFYFLNACDRKDAMHDFFASLSRKLKNPSPQDKVQIFKNDAEFGKMRFRSYLYVVAKNAAIDFVTEQENIKGRERVYLESVGENAGQLMSEILVEDSDLALEEIRKIAKVESRAWEIFCASMELSSQEIAEKYHMASANAVNAKNLRTRKKIHRVRRKILKHYGLAGGMFLDEMEEKF